MNKFIIPSLAAVVLATAGLTACQKNNSQNAPAQPQPAQPAPMQQSANPGATTGATSAAPSAASMGGGAKQSIVDTTITAKVKSALAANSRLKSSSLDVTTQNGVVTLSGSVPTQSDKALAASLASQVSGVSGVTNNIQVQSGGL